ncbi:hypothetical protein BGX23_004358 [Mortierella sp. AD031]|nr:hypothetical protein BGX23_004358 [Mortierella sp. AD031]
MSSKNDKPLPSSHSKSPSEDRPGSTKVSSLSLLEKASKKLAKQSTTDQDRSSFNALASVQLAPLGMFVPQDYQDASIPTTTDSNSKAPPTLSWEAPASPFPHAFLKTNDSDYVASSTFSRITRPPIASASLQTNSKAPKLLPNTPQSWPAIFPHNIAVPMFSTALPLPGARFETISQLAYCNILLRKHLSPTPAADSANTPLDPVQQGFLDAILQDKEELNRIRWLTNRIVQKFAAEKAESPASICEVILVAPFLDQEPYRMLLNCLITELEKSLILDDDLLQELVNLIRCAAPDYLHVGHLIRVFVILRTGLQNAHQQSAKLPYHLSRVISCLLDVMAEGKVKDLKNVVSLEALHALLRQLADNSDPYVEHQVTYSLQGLLHTTKDGRHQKFLLQSTGYTRVGNLRRLGLGGINDGVGHTYQHADDTDEVGGKVAYSVKTLLETGKGLWENVKDGKFSAGRLLWYRALREARDHMQDGRLVDFNRLVFEAPCCRDLNFQRGICLLLGEIAAESHWEETIRQHAVDFLAELYKTDFLGNPFEGVDQWILNILHQVKELSDPTISDHAQATLRKLESEGSATKLKIYRHVFARSLDPYPIKARLSVPPHSTLLSRVLSIPDAEPDLLRLRQKRLGGYQTSIYIPPQAKPTLWPSNGTLFPLMENVLEFLDSRRQVLLLLGDSGGGKSTFNLQLEHALWNDYQEGGPIPLYIDLPAIDKPEQDMITKQLQQLEFSDIQIREFRMSRQFIVICDGYDESQLKTNLYNSNRVNQEEQWKAKVLISCRTQYLSSNYRNYFKPEKQRYGHDRDGYHYRMSKFYIYEDIETDLFQEAVLVPFSKIQISQFVEQFVEKRVLNALDPTQFNNEPIWRTEDYMEKLAMIPDLMELVTNPFLLTLALEALPRLVSSNHNLESITVTRVELYDNFLERWLEGSKRRLESCLLSPPARMAFNQLLDGGFIQQGTKFVKALAAAIFKEQQGRSVVLYSDVTDLRSWKAQFFGPGIQTSMLRDSVPLVRSGNQYRFLHRSLLEYFNGICEYEIQELRGLRLKDRFEERCYIPPHATATLQESDTESSPLMVKVKKFLESDQLVFLLSGDSGSGKSTFVQHLEYELWRSYKKGGRIPLFIDLPTLDRPDKDLIAQQLMKHKFTETEIKDLEQHRQFTLICDGCDESQLTSNLHTTNTLNQHGRRDAKLLITCRTQYLGPNYRERFFPKLRGQYNRAAKDLFQEAFIIPFSKNQIEDYIESYTAVEPRLWTKEYYMATLAIIPNLMDLVKSPFLLTLALEVLPSFVQGRGDLSRSDPKFKEHLLALIELSKRDSQASQAAANAITILIRAGVRFNGSGLRRIKIPGADLSGGGFDSTDFFGANLTGVDLTRTWIRQADFGKAKMDDVMFGEYPYLHVATEATCCAYSPDGRFLAIGLTDGLILVYGTRTWMVPRPLHGHTKGLTCLAYSPDGQRLVSASRDRTISMWDITSGSERDFVTDCQSYVVESVAFSPDGHYFLTGGSDSMVQEWDALTGSPYLTPRVHANGVKSVAYSPDGLLIVSGGNDGQLRIWQVESDETPIVCIGHKDSVSSIACSPVGPEIASASLDGTVKLWNVLTGTLLAALRDHTRGVSSVSFSPNGTYIATSSLDKTEFRFGPFEEPTDRYLALPSPPMDLK